MTDENLPKGLLGPPRFDYVQRHIVFDFSCLGKRRPAIVRVRSQVLPDVAVKLFTAAWPRLWFEAVCRAQRVSGLVELDLTI